MGPGRVERAVRRTSRSKRKWQPMVARCVRGTVRVSLSSGYRGVAVMAKLGTQW